MIRKRFSLHPSVKDPVFNDQTYILFDLEYLDEYKEELVKLRNSKQLSPGTFQNKSFALNTFVEYLLKVLDKPPENGSVVKLSAESIYRAFSEYIRDPNRSKSSHTFNVVLNYTKEALRHILWEKYGVSLSRVFGEEIFDPNLYLSMISRTALRSKAIQLKTYQKSEQEKVVSSERIRAALRWLSILISERPTITVEKIRLATLIVLMTGARGTEINDLQFVTIDESGRKTNQIDLNRGIIYFRRAKLKTDTGGITPVFIHDVLISELKIFKRRFILDPTAPIFGYYSLDKVFTRYYIPREVFRRKKDLERAYSMHSWLRVYPPDKPIITIKLFRKFFDSHLQNMIYELVDNEKLGFMGFLSSAQLIDELRRYKNYLLGRAEGVDFMHYISLTEDKRFRGRYRRLTRMFVDSIIDEVMPELLRVLNEETLRRFFSGYKHSESKTAAAEMGEITQTVSGG